MRIIALALLLIAFSCSKKSDPPPVVEPELRPTYYQPLQSANYEMKSLEYSVIYSGTYRPDYWRMIYDSAGVERTIEGLWENGNAVFSFQHSDFLENNSQESPENVYDAHWPAWEFKGWSMAKKKEHSFFMTNPKPNQIELNFKTGVILKFNISDKSHFGITLHPPGAEALRRDKTAATNFMNNSYGLIQDSDSAKVGVQTKEWNVRLRDESNLR